MIMERLENKQSVEEQLERIPNLSDEELRSVSGGSSGMFGDHFTSGQITNFVGGAALGAGAAVGTGMVINRMISKGKNAGAEVGEGAKVLGAVR
jgi:hypothetical protein